MGFNSAFKGLIYVFLEFTEYCYTCRSVRAR